MVYLDYPGCVRGLVFDRDDPHIVEHSNIEPVEETLAEIKILKGLLYKGVMVVYSKLLRIEIEYRPLKNIAFVYHDLGNVLGFFPRYFGTLGYLVRRDLLVLEEPVFKKRKIGQL